MNNEDQQFENLENLTTEELEILEAKQNEAEETDDNSEATIDYKAKAEAAERRAATLQRLLNKQKSGKTINKTNTPDYSQDIQEIKRIQKIEVFAEENGLTKAQARKVFEINPNPTADMLKDPFIAEGLKALARKERVDNATPLGGRATTVNGKSFKEMNEDERKANYAKMIQG